MSECDFVVRKKSNSFVKLVNNKAVMRARPLVKKNKSVWNIRLKKSKYIWPLVRRNRGLWRRGPVIKNKLLQCSDLLQVCTLGYQKMKDEFFQKFDLKSNDRRAYFVSIYLVLLVLLVSAGGSFFSSPYADLDHTSAFMARIYGYNISIVVLYFICIHFWVPSSKSRSNFFDFVLLLNLVLIAVALFGWILFSVQVSLTGGHPSEFIIKFSAGWLSLSAGFGFWLSMYLISFIFSKIKVRWGQRSRRAEGVNGKNKG